MTRLGPITKYAILGITFGVVALPIWGRLTGQFGIEAGLVGGFAGGLVGGLALALGTRLAERRA